MKKYLVILLAGMACADVSWIKVDQYEPEYHLKGVQDDLYAGVPYCMSYEPDERSDPNTTISVVWDDVPEGSVIDGNKLIFTLPARGVYYFKATITHTSPDPDIVIPVEKGVVAVRATKILYLESVWKFFGFCLEGGE